MFILHVKNNLSLSLSLSPRDVRERPHPVYDKLKLVDKICQLKSPVNKLHYLWNIALCYRKMKNTCYDRRKKQKKKTDSSKKTQIFLYFKKHRNKVKILLNKTCLNYSYCGVSRKEKNIVFIV
jgi:hypothetical protein